MTALGGFRNLKDRKQRGSVALIAGVSMIGLLGFTGMAVDVGYLQWTRVRVQAAADAAAQAALIEAANGQSDVSSAGQASSALNGFSNGVNGVTVTINQPPTMGALSGNSNAVEAIVTVPTSTFFMGILGAQTVNVTARAAGSYPSSGSGSGSGTGSGSGSSGSSSSSMGCVYVLNPTGNGSSNTGLAIQGTSPTFNCGVVVESTNSQAVYISGADTVTMGTNYTLGVVGPSSCAAAQPALTSGCGIDYTSSSDYVCATGYSGSGCTGSHEPTASGIASPGDPLSNVSVPSFGTTFSTKDYYDMNSPPPGNTLSPGIYCGGLTIGNTNGATYTLSAGTYIMAGGSLAFQSTGTVSGSGVTFYLTSPNDVYTTTGTKCSSSLVSSQTSTTVTTVNINGQPNVTLSAPASGASSGIPGVLMFENRSNTTDSKPQIVGNSVTAMTGALYFKNSTLTYSGVNTGATDYTMIVVNNLVLNGSSPITVYNAGNPISSSTVTTGTAVELEE